MKISKKIDAAKQSAAAKSAKERFASLPKQAGAKAAKAGFAFALACLPEELAFRADSYHFEAFWAAYALPQLHGSDSRPNISGFANRAMRAIQGAAGAAPGGCDEFSRAWHAGAEISAASEEGREPNWRNIDESCPMDSCPEQSKACLKNAKLALKGYLLGIAWLESQEAPEAPEAPESDILPPADLLFIAPEAPEAPALILQDDKNPPASGKLILPE